MEGEQWYNTLSPHVVNSHHTGLSVNNPNTLSTRITQGCQYINTPQRQSQEGCQ